MSSAARPRAPGAWHAALREGEPPVPSGLACRRDACLTAIKVPLMSANEWLRDPGGGLHTGPGWCSARDSAG
ncbi:hypothetical protein GCM10023257_58660 [Streptomyces hyderabadensis]|uniref:Uncharacterized protein n=1 Tax=Streptomyces hyderabadensis TaxID=598549 RepID=A0ABP9IPX8_9ACTN